MSSRSHLANIDLNVFVHSLPMGHGEYREAQTYCKI